MTAARLYVLEHLSLSNLFFISEMENYYPTKTHDKVKSRYFSRSKSTCIFFYINASVELEYNETNAIESLSVC